MVWAHCSVSSRAGSHGCQPRCVEELVLPPALAATPLAALVSKFLCLAQEERSERPCMTGEKQRAPVEERTSTDLHSFGVAFFVVSHGTTVPEKWSA